MAAPVAKPCFSSPCDGTRWDTVSSPDNVDAETCPAGNAPRIQDKVRGGQRSASREAAFSIQAHADLLQRRCFSNDRTFVTRAGGGFDSGTANIPPTLPTSRSPYPFGYACQSLVRLQPNLPHIHQQKT